MSFLTPGHLVLVLAIALLVLGPGKLPETGAALGKAIRSFREGVEGRDEIQPALATPVAQAMGTIPQSATASPVDPARPSIGPEGDAAAR